MSNEPSVQDVIDVIRDAGHEVRFVEGDVFLVKHTFMDTPDADPRINEGIRAMFERHRQALADHFAVLALEREVEEQFDAEIAAVPPERVAELLDDPLNRLAIEEALGPPNEDKDHRP